MLVLTRRPGESLRIGDGIEIHVIRIEGDRVVLGIAAPPDVNVVRTELLGDAETGSDPSAGQSGGGSSRPDR